NNTQESSDDSLNRESNFSDCTGTKPKFKFPPPPRLIKSANNSYCSTASDSSNSGVNRSFNVVKKKRHKIGFAKKLPPLGIFWDIENCHVPKSKSASDVVQRIREVFLENYREAEFVVVCDVKKETPQIIQELHDSQVNLIHVSSTSKNAADEKLRQSLRRFAEVYPAPSGIVLISSDINFAADLSDLRYRKKNKSDFDAQCKRGRSFNFVKSQHGFLGGKSSETALFELMNFIYSTLDDGCIACGIFLDLSRAFECINHTILTKLSHYGIWDTASDWLRSYLMEGKHAVKLPNVNCGNNVLSEALDMITRVNLHSRGAFVTVTDLPLSINPKRIKNRLRMLVENCGGKIVEVCAEEGLASIRFATIDAALRFVTVFIEFFDSKC
ncbi:hypothetical protein NQ314_015932, partial [Rhamnusium bicolor]